MTISKLNIHNFRNIESASILFSPSFNFIIGQNGSGKTSLLEAIYMLGHGRSFRHLHASKVINHVKNELTIFAEINLSNQKRHSVGLSKSKKSLNKIKIDNDSNYKIADLTQLLPIQLIHPESFELVTGSPKIRRAYIDWGCFHHYAKFYSLWHHYHHLIKQRNALLKTATNYTQLLHWDKSLAPICESLTALRRKYITLISEHITEICTMFLPEYQFEIAFFQGWQNNLTYQEVLQSNFQRDKHLGFTSYGAHKASLKIKHQNIIAEDLLSRGQLKLLMCAMKISQGIYYSQQKKQRCLFLIDDFASELDENKRRLLANLLKKIDAQVFISAISHDQIDFMNNENHKIFNIKSGIINEYGHIF